MIITVARGDVQPMDMHLHNQADGSWNSPKNYSDMYQTPVFVRCEAGNKLQSETLASICDQVLKFFRRDIMAEFDIHDYSVKSITSPIQIAGVAGEPWQTSVIVQVQTQEMFQITEFANTMNKLNVVQQFKKTAAKKYDTSLNPSIQVTPQNGIAETEPA